MEKTTAPKCFAVIGTDARQAAAGRALARAGYAVGGAEQVALADYILLPLPLDAARTPLAELLRAARPGALALGGMLSAEARAIAAEAGVELVDYFAREELTIRNAVPTAEGALEILLHERSRTLWGSAVLLLADGLTAADVSVTLELPEQYILGTKPEVYAVYTVNGQDKQESASVRVPATITGLQEVLDANVGVQPGGSTGLSVKKIVALLLVVSLGGTVIAAGAAFLVVKLRARTKKKARH